MAFKYKRSVREGLQSNLLLTAREAQDSASCIGKCTTFGPGETHPVDDNGVPLRNPDPGRHTPCSETSLAAGGRHYCYVSEVCKDARRSRLDRRKLWSTE